MKAKNYINGKWVNSKSSFKTINPNTGKVLGEIPKSNTNEIKDAISSAKTAFKSWKETHIDERIQILNKVVILLTKLYGDEGGHSPMKDLITKEVGKMLPEADIEVIESIDIIQYYIDNAKNILKERRITLNKSLWPNKESSLYFEPIGVVAIIKAWNYPLEVPIWSIIPALISGNTVVFKPSEHSTFVAIELMKLFEDAGLPKGVINMISGDSTTGRNLVNSDGIDLISFTGSQKVGREINTIAANKFIKCILELSGNDAAIIDKSANLELTSNGLVWGAFCNSGQVCVGVKRAYMHDSISNELIKSILEKTNNLIPGKDYGPLISKKQLDLVDSFVKDAVKKGAKVLTGGKIIKKIEGFYYLPTILVNVTQEMKVIKEECFGNILPIIQYDDIEKAIIMANNSDYGLGSSVWCSNISTADYIASKMQTGMVWINDVNVAFPEAPWLGRKKSGGGIDLSEFGLYEYVNIKHINKENSSDEKRTWWFPY